MSFKIILTGATGRIGSEVLRQCLENASIKSVVVLTRRPLPDAQNNPKVQVLVIEDFNRYSEDVIAKLSGADGCIWCMTTPSIHPELELDYPKAFADALSKTLAQHGKKFRYMHLTGAMVERDQTKPLWLKGDMRKLKGQGEVQMIDFAKSPAANGLWETIVARPGGVVQRGTMLGETSVLLGGGSGWAIRSDELALALIDAVLNGSEEQLLERESLVKRGRALIQKKG